MSHYKNFKTAFYFMAQLAIALPLDELQREIEFFQKYVGVDKVYLEPFRLDALVPPEKLRACIELFRKNGIEVSGGLTPTTLGTPEDKHRQRVLNPFCYCNDRMRQQLKSIVEYIAAEFDEFIIDDFFFTNCTCDDCRAAKGDRSWEEFRLELMRQVAQELIIAPAKAVNPAINIIIKFPNWMESYQESGYNPGQQRDMFDMVYTGTETRHQKHTDQHLPRYLSYSIMRWMENFAPGKNGGGWFDALQCYPIDVYLEQGYLTALARPREITLYCWATLYKNKAVAPLGMQLEQLDAFLSAAGNPVGLPCYLPVNAQGEDHVEDYLGMCGIPFESVPYFPKEAKSVFLTVQATYDPDILPKLEKFVANGGKAIVTSGFVKEMLGKGIENMTSIRYRDRRFTATAFMSEPPSGYGNDFSHSCKPVTFPVMEFRTNTTWALAKAFGDDESYGLLLRDYYGKGQLLTLVVPDAISEIRHLPQTVLNKLRCELSDVGVLLDAPSQISLFAYDNDTLCLYPYLCDDCAPCRVQLRVRGNATELYPIATEPPWFARSVKPLYATPAETVFELTLTPGNPSLYGIRRA